MRGIFITSQSPKGQRITGHYLSKHGGQWRVHVFTNCTRAFVIRQASEVIHCPPIFNLQPQPPKE
jgi:hypothetical protein